MTLRVRRVMHS